MFVSDQSYSSDVRCHDSGWAPEWLLSVNISANPFGFWCVMKCLQQWQAISWRRCVKSTLYGTIHNVSFCVCLCLEITVKHHVNALHIIYSLFSLNCRHNCGDYVTDVTCVPCHILCYKYSLVITMVFIMRRSTCVNDCMTIQYYPAQPGPLICVVRVINRGTMAYHLLHISRTQYLYLEQIVLKMCQTKSSNYHVIC